MAAKATEELAPSLPPGPALSALAQRIAREATAGKRFLLGVTGSPGGGKTTVAKALTAHLNAQGEGYAAYVPMDGFHLANSTLDRLGLRGRKGAIDTFDGWGFLALLDRLRNETGHTVYAPSFDRTIDEGVTGDIAIAPGISVAVVEGNYLLAEQEPWNRVRGKFDAAWFCSTPSEEREGRLISRHTQHGRSVAAATAWARDVDGANASLVEATRGRADLIFSGVTGEILWERLQ